MALKPSRRDVLRFSAGVAGLAAFGLPERAARAVTDPTQMNWWTAARFGMFIHFGSYSYLGQGEWAFQQQGWSKRDYQTQVSAHFDPTAFDAAAIVDLAKNAGMKYLVITSKHHEGFAMWGSSVAGFTDYTGTKRYNLRDYTAYRGEVLGALKGECDKAGIAFGLYYSIMDWNHPSQTIRNTDTVFTSMSSMTARSRYIDDMKAHLQELLNAYDPAILWFDGDWCKNHDQPTLDDWWVESDGVSLYQWLMSLKPDLIVNERVKRDLGLGDYAVAEGGVPVAPLPRDWETCATMNGAWGYDSGAEGSYRAPSDIIAEMVDAASKGGNYLLNIGPRGDGTVTGGAVDILNALAAWMGIYGDSIHGAGASPYGVDPAWGKCTTKPGALYAHVLTWPADGRLRIPALTNTIHRIYPMSDPSTSLAYTTSSSGITVSVPSSAPDASDSVVVVEMSGQPLAATNIVSGGIYKLICQNSGKALDNGSSSSDGATAMQWTDNGGSQQRWRIIDVGDGYYKLICAFSGKALDNGSSRPTAKDGDAVMQWTDTGASQQQWRIYDVGDGYYKLISRYGGRALDNGNTGGDGATTLQWTDNLGSPQRWQLLRVG